MLKELVAKEEEEVGRRKKKLEEEGRRIREEEGRRSKVNRKSYIIVLQIFHDVVVHDVPSLHNKSHALEHEANECSLRTVVPS